MNHELAVIKLEAWWEGNTCHTGHVCREAEYRVEAAVTGHELHTRLPRYVSHNRPERLVLHGVGAK